MTSDDDLFAVQRLTEPIPSCMIAANALMFIAKSSISSPAVASERAILSREADTLNAVVAAPVIARMLEASAITSAIL